MGILISVIMPCYNGENYIKAAIDSYLLSFVPGNTELIIIDDGSTDDSERIISDSIYNNPSAQIRYFKQRNSGVSVARNHGIEMAEGKYLCFFDCDDVIGPNYYETLLIGFDNCSVDLSFCEWEYLGKKQHTRTKNAVVSIETFAKKYLYQAQRIHLCSILFKKSIIDSFKIKFSEELRYGEDQNYIWKYIARCKKAYYTNSTAYYYRVSVSSAMKKYSPERIKVVSAFKDNESLILDEMPSFFKKYKQYAVPRAVLSVLKDAALQKDYSLYSSLCSQYDSINYRGLLLHNKLKIRFAALLLIVSKKVFFDFFSTCGR